MVPFVIQKQQLKKCDIKGGLGFSRSKKTHVLFIPSLQEVDNHSQLNTAEYMWGI